MESDGPYSVKNYKYRWCVDGLDKEHTLNQFRYKKWAEWWASQLNTAHFEGRKAERERCAKIAEDHALLLNSPGEAAACREVAEMIRGGQDGE